MEILIKQTWLLLFIPLGLALFKSIWQGLLVYGIYKSICFLFPKTRSEYLYMIGLGSLGLTLGLFILGVYSEYSHFIRSPIELSIFSPEFSHFWSSSPLFPSAQPLELAPIKESFQEIKTLAKPTILYDIWVNPISISQTGNPFWLNLYTIIPIQLGFSLGGFIYLICMGYMILRWGKGVKRLNAYRQKKDRFPLDDQLKNLIGIIKTKMGISREVECWLSNQVNSPITFGLIKPIILFPLAVCSQLSISQMEGILIHELAHIKRNDFLINIFQCVAETLLFFNPAGRLLNQEIRNERENCCDDQVSRYYSGNLMTYARTLLSVKELSAQGLFKGIPTSSSLSLSAIGIKNQFYLRIDRIILGDHSSSLERNPRMVMSLFSLIIGASLIGLLSSSKFIKKNSPFELSSATFSKKTSLSGGKTSILYDQTQNEGGSKDPLKMNQDLTHGVPSKNPASQKELAFNLSPFHFDTLAYQRLVQQQLKDTLKLPLTLDSKIKDSLNRISALFQLPNLPDIPKLSNRRKGHQDSLNFGKEYPPYDFDAKIWRKQMDRAKVEMDVAKKQIQDAICLSLKRKDQNDFILNSDIEDTQKELEENKIALEASNQALILL
jgi:beta-lactamase regulating signal transducer with metallopeptidase domain